MKLVPELSCFDLEASLHFYCELMGFKVLYARPEEKFVYLELNGVHIMLCEINAGEIEFGHGWNTATLEKPLGRGINFEFEVESVDDLYEKLQAAQWPIFLAIHDAWYRKDDIDVGNRQFLVLDPDGYQLRPVADLGERELA